MKYTVAVTERVNPGNYEFIEVSAGVEFTEADAQDAGLTPAEFGAEQLDALLLSHRRRAMELTPEDAPSFINDHPALEK